MNIKSGSKIKIVSGGSEDHGILIVGYPKLYGVVMIGEDFHGVLWNGIKTASCTGREVTAKDTLTYCGLGRRVYFQDLGGNWVEILEEPEKKVKGNVDMDN